MKYLACGECGRLLAAIVPKEPNGILTLECPNTGNGYEHTVITIDLKKTALPIQDDPMRRSVADQIEGGGHQRTD